MMTAAITIRYISRDRSHVMCNDVTGRYAFAVKLRAVLTRRAMQRYLRRVNPNTVFTEVKTTWNFVHANNQTKPKQETQE